MDLRFWRRLKLRKKLKRKKRKQKDVTGGERFSAGLFLCKGLKHGEFFDWDVKEKPHPMREDS